MRANLVASFLHKPKIMFLDEPTIGLDALAKEKVREFLKEINKKEKVTILLTTHDMGDIEELCKRIIFLNKGEILYDGELNKFKRKYILKKNITLTFTEIKNKDKFDKIKNKIEIKKQRQNYLEGEIDIKDSSKTIKELFDCLEITDLEVNEMHLDEIIKEYYKEHR